MEAALDQVVKLDLNQFPADKLRSISADMGRAVLGAAERFDERARSRAMARASKWTASVRKAQLGSEGDWALAILSQMLGDFARAKDLFGQAEGSLSGSPEFLSDYGGCLVDYGDYAEGIRKLDDAIRLAQRGRHLVSTHLSALVKKAETLIVVGRPVEALSTLERPYKALLPLPKRIRSFNEGLPSEYRIVLSLYLQALQGAKEFRRLLRTSSELIDWLERTDVTRNDAAYRADAEAQFIFSDPGVEQLAHEAYDSKIVALYHLGKTKEAEGLATRLVPATKDATMLAYVNSGKPRTALRAVANVLYEHLFATIPSSEFPPEAVAQNRVHLLRQGWFTSKNGYLDLYSTGYEAYAVELILKAFDEALLDPTGEAALVVLRDMAVLGIRAHGSKLKDSVREALNVYPNVDGVQLYGGLALMRFGEVAHGLEAARKGAIGEYWHFGKALDVLENPESNVAVRALRPALEKVRGEQHVGILVDLIVEELLNRGYQAQAAKWAWWYRSNVTREAMSPPLLPRILELGGNAALRAGDFTTARELFAALVHVLGRNVGRALYGHEAYGRHKHGRARLLLGIANYFGGQHSSAQEALVEGKFLGADEQISGALESLLLAGAGEVEAAVAKVSEVSLPGWLLKPLGDHIREVAAETGMEKSPEVVRLQYQIAALNEDVPAIPDLLSELDSRRASEEAALEEAMRATVAKASVSNALNMIVASLPLSPEDEKARQRLIRATESAALLPDAAEAFVKEVLKRYREPSLSYETLASVGLDQYLSREEYEVLPEAIRQRLVTTGSYYPIAAKSRLDLGPAALALISALEWIVKTGIVEPIVERLDRNGTLPKAFSGGAHRITLGKIPYLFGTHPRSNPADVAPVLEVARQLYPGSEAFLLEVLPRNLEGPTVLRNAWAHGQGTISLKEFEALVSQLFSDPALLVRAARIAYGDFRGSRVEA